MKVKYDKESDILYIKLGEAEIFESDESKNGIILDYSSDNHLVWNRNSQCFKIYTATCQG